MALCLLFLKKCVLYLTPERTQANHKNKKQGFVMCTNYRILKILYMLLIIGFPFNIYSETHPGLRYYKAIRHAKQAEYDKAIEHFAKAQYDFLVDGEMLKVAKCYHNIGKCFYFLGDYNLGMKNYNCSLNFDITDSLKALIINDIGIINKKMGKFGKALENFFRAASINKINGYKYDLARNYNNIGNVLILMDSLDEAESYFKKSIKIKRGLFDVAGIANTLNNIGDLYLKNFKFKKALQFLKESISESNKFSDSEYFIIVYQNLGDAYNGIGDEAKSTHYFNKALKTAENIGDQYSYSKILLLMSELRVNNYNSPLTNLNTVIKYFKDNNLYLDLVNAYKVKAGYLENKGKLKDAIEFYKLSDFEYRKLMACEKREVVSTKQRIAKSIQIMSSLRNDYKEERNRNQTIIINSICFGIAVFFIGLIVFLRNIIKKQKDRLSKKQENLNIALNGFNKGN